MKEFPNELNQHRFRRTGNVLFKSKETIFRNMTNESELRYRILFAARNEETKKIVFENCNRLRVTGNLTRFDVELKDCEGMRLNNGMIITEDDE